MKKLLFVLFAASTAFVSCEKSLGENEYEVTGTIGDTIYNGKKVYLEKQGGYMGFVPVDTAVVENGKFVFKDTVSGPSLHFISFEDKPQEKANFILERGRITIDINTDTIYKSVQGGSFNNEKLHDYYTKTMANNNKMRDFQKENQSVMMKARQENDTATMNKLQKDYEALTKDMETTNKEFVKNNPKAYVNVFIIKQLLGSGNAERAEVEELYNNLDAEVKKTKDAKEIEEMLAKMKETEEAQAKVSEGKVAPDFSAPNPEGQTVSLKDAMGKVTIIDFWASWCGPCRKENPNVVAMYNELHDKGLNIIGVSLDKNAEAWKKAIADDNLTWTHISHLKHWEDPIAAQYGVRSIPATFVLDENGTIVAKNLRGEELKAKVKELLNK
ncbi:thiol:disulfide interchange protein [Flavobacterium suaedae]|uniref:Thiol:disulfide interchange protein n=1 Tax=Flavobacterium suaedae TaxID=1767027 RepID=A0ABQ1JWS6_9FLAO|nr:TlpA disulfide reductase family protein [Flavobacterium suaedae]GGB80680.1 thiol:disulfide interchange protein [Flavobacterium suaedae]